MPAPTSDPLLELARLRGIEPSYVDLTGKTRTTSAETCSALLSAMGLPVGTRAEVEASLRHESARAWRHLVDPVTVLRQGPTLASNHSHPSGSRDALPGACTNSGPVSVGGTGTLVLHVPEPTGAERQGALALTLRTESGETTVLDGASAERGETREVDGVQHVRLEIPLPELPIGYHEVEASWSGEGARRETGMVAIVPRHCWMPEGVPEKRRLWGMHLNLYSIRSPDDFGLGTVADAGDLGARISREYGAALVGLPPLHATANRRPFDHSPYGPLTRTHWNVTALDPLRVPEVRDSPRARALLESAAFRARLDALRAADEVQWKEAQNVRLELLRAAFDDLRDTADLDRFLAERGEELALWGTFEALRHRGLAQDPPQWSWPDWPAELRDPRSRAVAAFRRENANSIRFHGFVQLCVERQIAEAQRTTLEAGMELGLYFDLAVGSGAAGCDAWAHPDLFPPGAEVGAPPDYYCTEGQAWGVLPMDPVRLRERRYGPFLAMLRCAMRHGGAIRIDHVMGLFHAFWVPRGAPATTGAYVQFPHEEVLGLLALESHRHRVLVVGEDLGTVAPGIRERLQQERILGCKLAMFERDEAGAWLPPESYPPLSVASFANHDLPTFPGFWEGSDLDARKRAGHFPDAAEEQRQRDARPDDLRKLAESLRRDGVELAETDGLPASFEAAVAFHRWLARVGSAVAIVSLEDVTGELDQRNLPGTAEEHPNWCVRFPRDWRASLDDPCARAAGEAMAARVRA